MKMADVLRNMADMLDQTAGDNVDNQNKADLTPVKVDTSDDTESVTMIPPLQQKLEILKKSVGMDNAFDATGEDELDDIKKLTGIKAVVQHVAGEDNDVVG
jgi:uncharacterized protein YfkK (UPF0435 family)